MAGMENQSYQSVMTIQLVLFIAGSMLGMLVGLALLFFVSWRKASGQNDFKWLRMVGLLMGCLLLPSPLAAGAWLTRDGGGMAFPGFMASAIMAALFSPALGLRMVKWVRGDDKQF